MPSTAKDMILGEYLDKAFFKLLSLLHLLLRVKYVGNSHGYAINYACLFKNSSQINMMDYLPLVVKLEQMVSNVKTFLFWNCFQGFQVPTAEFAPVVA